MWLAAKKSGLPDAIMSTLKYRKNMVEFIRALQEG
jgi:hypothetical protein